MVQKLLSEMILSHKDINLVVIGLGYVGLPLALEFSKKRKVIGFDINKKRINDLKSGMDINLEFKANKLKNIKNLTLTNNVKDLYSSNCYIITVPTPIDDKKKPDLFPLLKSTEMISKILKKNDIVIYESTVYPGCIEEKCVPILEKYSKLKFNQNFFCGYSPERINPGDKTHTISKIKKVTSGSNNHIADLVDNLYSEIISVGTYKAPNIKIAEAAKVIENIQRDINIALINELSILFNKLNIDTEEVLKAAGSKWNFLNFKPGLVGGHCIGVDPYYLTHKSQSIGYNPKVILAGREINDNMGSFVAKNFIKALRNKNIKINKAKILIMGLTFKEDCADTRNSGVENVVKELIKFDCSYDLFDPWADRKIIKKTYGKFPCSNLKKNNYDGIIITVAHKKFKKIGIKFISKLCKKNHVIYDLKFLFKKKQTSMRL